ncbi:hypothetical protein LS73_001325 [Helicobacter muridarum]|uniref:Uncharacterized protein n=1 Tax=Helicobacter muridarum TaxID=216 RepID=A0A099TW52_9HELI|nr:hypothetical protein [Helicobacter muridarum]TLE01352.1 hypothetical protein LS73_001325 [Helicobacter muridarum]STQ85277.1 Uncharacterised protein [Helicobacter muridarum]
MSIIGTILRPLFATVLISINHDEDVCVVHVIKKRGDSIVDDIRKEFKIINGEPSAETIKYINKFKKRYAYSYLATLSKNTDQVLVPSIKKDVFPNFGVNDKEFKSIKLPNSSIFIHKDEILNYQKTFKGAKGLDFLFSPFILLFLKSKTITGNRPKMFVLQEKENLATLIATRKDILYGSLFRINSQENLTTIASTKEQSNKESKVQSNAKNSEDLKNLDTELDDLEQDLQDFDSFDFSELEMQDMNVEEDAGGGGEKQIVSSGDNLQDLGRSTSIIQLLQSSLRDFYQNTLYDSDFVEEIVIFDCYGMSSQSVHNIKSNLMIDVSLIPIDLPKEIINLSQIELDS